MQKYLGKEEQIMETEFQNAVGKGIGEVRRDIADFLSMPYIINPEKQVDLCSLIPDLNMHEQFSFALLSEAAAQGWSPDTAEAFYRQATAGVIDPAIADSMILAFRNRDGEEYRAYNTKYGNRFTALDGSYWATAMALGIDAGRVSEVMQYLRIFTVTLMEFAYMEDRNPDATYTWCYYDSFNQMLEELITEPTDPLPLKVRALGGSASKRDGDAYYLSLGLDLENPNTDRMARGVQIDITLKDREGKIITVIRDRLDSLDPAVIYHYGITRRVRGAAVGSIAATAVATSYLSLQTPIMKHFTLSDLRLKRASDEMQFHATVTGEYDKPLHSLTLHYQFLSRENKILGGGSEWLCAGLKPETPTQIVSRVAVSIKDAAKVVYSMDFDAMELVEEG